MKRKVAKRIEQADGHMVLAVLECGHELYGLRSNATDHVCIQCRLKDRDKPQATK